MKKIVVGLSLMLVMLSFITGTVNAATTAKIDLQTANTVVSKNQTVVIDINLSDITTSRGAVAFMATIDYEKDSLTLESIEGQNGWSPIPTFNQENGKIVIHKGSNVTKSETIMKITFKVKENAKANTVVTLKDITFSEGIEDITVDNNSIRLTVKEENSIPNPEPNIPVDDNNTVTNNTIENTVTPIANNTISNNVTNNNTQPIQLNVISNNTTTNTDTASGKMPQTGTYSTFFSIMMIVSIILAIIFFIRIKMIDKEMNK